MVAKAPTSHRLNTVQNSIKHMAFPILNKLIEFVPTQEAERNHVDAVPCENISIRRVHSYNGFQKLRLSRWRVQHIACQ